MTMADTPPPVSLIPQGKMPRFSTLKETFVAKYGTYPEFFVRAPGRVNLIGEHIDYCGYSVLPMAIEQDIVIAAAANDSGKIVLSNTDSNFSEYSCATDNIEIDKSKPLWFHYFLCGYKGVLEHLSLKNPKGMNLVLDGTVPRSAGLSSSSALVCCAALTTAHINGQQMGKVEIADMCALCEQYIGTIGGGMDQAICFLAEAGKAKLVEFNPLKATNVSLPQGVVFVISNSCVEMNKAATSHFNIRVVECRLACQIMAKEKGLNWREIKKLGDLQKTLGITLEDAIKLTQSVLHPEPYSKEEVCNILGVSAEELAQTSLSQNTLTVASFKLHDRATHVYSEAKRVWDFKKICDEQPHNASEMLGQLMNDSHTSCRDLYECSCPDLDHLVDLCIQSGALGSRLTGAGWGGCAVSMVPADCVQEFITAIQQRYYAKDPAREARVKESLFATVPGSGAVIYKWDD